MSERPPVYLTTRELAELLRLSERKVYDLAASGGIPCTKATGKLLFARAEIEAWLSAHRSGSVAGARPAVFLGSRDPLLEWALSESRSGLASYLEGSLDGLARFAEGAGVAAGLHLFDPESGAWNTPAVAALPGAETAALISWATRARGLVLGRGLGRRVRGVGDLDGLRVATRQPEAGAEQLFRHLLAEAGATPQAWAATVSVRSEAEAALAVAEGRADAAFGLAAAAAPYGLDFAPIVEERFDLLVDRRSWFDPPLQRLWAFCRTQAFADRAERTAGYDVSSLGEVRWNGGGADQGAQ